LAITESGHNGVIESLGGVKNRPGFGRTSYYATHTLGVLDDLDILPENTRRISALIQNYGSGSVFINFSSGYAGQGMRVYLSPGGSIQIDKDFPWTGYISARGILATTIIVNEISVQ